MTTEEKALALLNEVQGSTFTSLTRDSSAIEALCRAIEQHEATKQEVERLNGLITATADHWLTLQVKHPIQWEGAINGAMAAACAEIEKHEAFKQKVSDALLRYHAPSHVPHGLQEFIIPAPKPDPLQEAAKMMGYFNTAANAWAEDVRASLDALGFEIREKNDD